MVENVVELCPIHKKIKSTLGAKTSSTVYPMDSLDILARVISDLSQSKRRLS